MIDRLPRSAERVIGVALVLAAGVGGYALRGHNSEVAVTAPATSHNSMQTKATAPKPKPTHSVTSTQVLKKADMQLPLTPTGGEYNVAAQAVSNVYGGGDIPSGQALLKTIKNPGIKAQTNHAIQEAITKQATANVYASGDVNSAEELLQHVTLPDIKPRAVEAVATVIASTAVNVAYGGNDIKGAKALESRIADPTLVAQVNEMIHYIQTDNSDGASNLFSELSTEASDQYTGISVTVADEYQALNRHTDSYLQQYNAAK